MKKADVKKKTYEEYEAYGLEIEKSSRGERFTSSEVLHWLLMLLCILCSVLIVQQMLYHNSATRFETAVSVMDYSVEQSISASVATQEKKNAPVNINTADADELCRLSGIGEVKAQAIIDYRTENGLFTYPEEIMKVSGIGEGIYKKIASQIILSDAELTSE